MLQPIIKGMIDIDIQIIANPKSAPPNRIPVIPIVMKIIPKLIQHVAKQHIVRQ